MKVIDLAVVSSDLRFQKRATTVSRAFNFDCEVFESTDAFFETAENYKSISCIILDCGKIEKPNEAAGMVQVACQIAAESYIIVVMNSKLKPEDARVVKTSGASVFFVTHDLEEAIYLGDRVIGLHANPGRIGATFQVTLPKPRDQLSTRELPEFLSLRRQLFDFIKDAEHEQSQ